MRLSLIPLAICLAVSAAATGVNAAIIEKSIAIKRPGSSGTFMPLSYVDENDAVIPLAGAQIIETRVHLNYEPSSADELAEFSYILSVPVADLVLGAIHIDTAMLTAVSPTAYGYDLTTDDFNGTILDTSFGYELFGHGTYSSDSAVTFIISVPEPTTLAVATPVVALAVRRRRR
jgi:hypothetical protein